MKTCDILPDIYRNFESFIAMTTAAALVSSYNSPEGDRDARSVIRFIGDAYALERELTGRFEECILGRMMNIGLITDYHALCAGDLLDEEDRENLELYEIKGRVLEQITAHEAYNFAFADMRMAHQVRFNMKYEYFHHPYHAVARFWSVESGAAFGSILLTRQLALLYALGIGHEVDYRKAEKLLLRCVLWDDAVSARLLNHLCRQTGCEKYEDGMFGRLYVLMKQETELNLQFLDGSEEERICCLLKMVKRYVTALGRDYQINIQLADMLLSDQLTHHQKMQLIVQFQERRMKALPLANSGRRSIGFRVKKHE
jgi:hypothetical protein